MDSHYTNNFDSAFQNIIPNYNPQAESHHESKDFSSSGQQQNQHQDPGHFNVLVYQQPSAFNAIDSNNLYSDLDTIDETPLVHSNIAAMDLYDTDPLDNGMINHSEQNLFQPTSNMQQNMFGSYEEPKLAHFNTNIVQAHMLQQVDNAVPAQPNIIQTNASLVQNSAIPSAIVTSNIIQQANVVLPQSNMHSKVIQVTQSPSNVIQANANSIQTSIPNATNPTTKLNPMPTRSFYQNRHNHAQTVTDVKPEEKSQQPEVETNGVANHAHNEVSEDMDTEANANVEQETENASTDVTNGMEEEQDPLANEDSSEPVTNGVSDDGDKEEERKDEKKDELEKCVREGCDNVAVVNTEWEDEYCSNECCIKHCTSVFNAWVQENLKSGVQNEGNNTMM